MTSSIPREEQQKLFTNEILGACIRWMEESDLDEMELAEAAVEALNLFTDNMLEFTPDPEFLEELNEESEPD